MARDKRKAGGKREGAGRPKGAPTKLIRIPVHLEPLILEFRDHLLAQEKGGRNANGEGENS